MGSIDPKTMEAVGLCIKCQACVRKCTRHAKFFEDPDFRDFGGKALHLGQVIAVGPAPAHLVGKGVASGEGRPPGGPPPAGPKKFSAPWPGRWAKGWAWSRNTPPSQALGVDDAQAIVFHVQEAGGILEELEGQLGVLLAAVAEEVAQAQHGAAPVAPQGPSRASSPAGSMWDTPMSWGRWGRRTASGR